MDEPPPPYCDLCVIQPEQSPLLINSSKKEASMTLPQQFNPPKDGKRKDVNDIAEPHLVAVSRAFALVSLISLQPWFFAPAIFLSLKRNRRRSHYKISIALSITACALWLVLLISCISYFAILVANDSAAFEDQVQDAIDRNLADKLRILFQLKSVPLTKKKALIERKDNDNNSLIHIAAKRGYFGVIRVLVDRMGADFERRGAYNKTALVQAIISNNLEVVAFLLKKGAKLDAEDKDSCSKVIHLALLGNNLEIVDNLLRLRTDLLEVRDEKFGRTPLLQAVGLGNLTMLKYLVESGAKLEVEETNSGSKPIHLAAVNGTEETVEYLLSLRSDWLEVRDTKFGRTPLLKAAEGGNLAVLKFLLKRGAKLDIDNNDAGVKPIHLAASSGNVETVQYLLSLRHDWLEVKDLYTERTPLLKAAEGGNLAVLKYLVITGAQLDAELRNKPIHLAAFSGNVETVDYLLSLRSDWLEVKDGVFRRTPLLKAAEGGNLAVLKYLLGKGANLDVEDSERGNKAIHLAAFSGNVETVDYLLSLRSDWLEVRDTTYGKTPLLKSAKGGNLPVLKYLIDKGAKLYARDTYLGSNAMHLAASSGSIETLTFLVERDPTFLKSKDKDGELPIWYANNAENYEEVIAFLKSKTSW